MSGNPTSWDTIFRICLGGYVICSALFFLTLFTSERRKRRQQEKVRATEQPYERTAQSSHA